MLAGRGHPLLGQLTSSPQQASEPGSGGRGGFPREEVRGASPSGRDPRSRASRPGVRVGTPLASWVGGRAHPGHSSRGPGAAVVAAYCRVELSQRSCKLVTIFFIEKSE